MRKITTASIYCSAVFLLICIGTTISHGQETPVLEWARRMGGTGGTNYAEGESIAIDAAGNSYTTGFFQGTVDFDPGTAVFNLTAVGNRDAFIFKLDANGNLVWAKQLGGTSEEQGFDLDVDLAGNVYTTGDLFGTADFDPGPGIFNLTSAGSADIFISKLDTDGNFVWAKRIGATGIEEGYGLKVDGSSNVFLTGHFAGSVDFDPGAAVSFMTSAGGRDIFITKLNSNGDFIWAKRMGGTDFDEGRSIAVDATQNVYITGYFVGTADFDPGPAAFNLTSAGNEDIYIAKLNASGDFMWAGQIGDFDFDSGQSIAVDPSGNVYVTGYFQGTADFDPGASTASLTSAGMQDIFVLKLDTNGNFLWAKRNGQTTRDDGNALNVDSSGNVYITGYFQGTVDFDPGAGVFNLTSTAQLDIFIFKLTTAGDFVWAVKMGSAVWDQGFAIAADANHVYTTGYIRSTADLDPGPCTFNLTPLAIGDVFVQKLRKQATPGNPSISSFTPASGPAGTVVTINGINFNATASGNVVSFNGTAAVVTSSTSTSISTTVPAGATTGKISVTVNCVTVQSAANFTVGGASVPTITSFTPSSGAISTTVTITGTNFSATPANNTVAFNGTTATATASSATSITTTVPAGATTGKITVTVGGNTATSATDFTVSTPSLPTITSFTPTSGPVTTVVTITGTNFSATTANNEVKFNGTSALVTASTTTGITTTVPTGATTGKITVTIGGNTATSATDFTVTTGAPTIAISQQPQSANGCEGETISFTLTASGAANLTYQWQKFNGTIFTNISNGGGYTGVTTTTLSINTAGNFGDGEYRCRISGDLATDVFSETADLIVNSYPVATIDATGTQLMASGGDTYQWYQNGNMISQATNQTLEYSVTEFGAYTVEVTENGCTSASDEFVYLITAAESNDQQWKVYPNPFTNEINVSLPSIQAGSIELVDALGRSVKSFLAGSTTLSTEDVSTGAYYLIIHSGNTRTHIKLLKVH